MRVLLINTSERTGGASIAAVRLLRALNRNGVDAEMLVRDKLTDNPRIHALPGAALSRLKFVAERAEIFVRNGFSRQSLFSIDTGSFGTDITSLPAFKRADIIHLHWVNQGMLSLSDLRRIFKSGKKVVWTLHDLWLCTGICHAPAACDRWQAGCGYCPLLPNGGSEKDLSYSVFRKKQALLHSSDVKLVACSNWLADLAARSPLLEGRHVESIPNPIDTSFYNPAPREVLRKRLGLPEEKKVLLFVAYKATDELKGIQYLRQSLEKLCTDNPALRQGLCLIIIGREATTLKDTFPIEVLPVEYTADANVMADYYRVANVLVMPTLIDNLPNTIVEAMSCGTPCVAFRVGGVPQMIDHGANGYLARLKDIEDFGFGLLHILYNDRYEAICRSAREKAVYTYSEQAVTERYLQIYQS